MHNSHTQSVINTAGFCLQPFLKSQHALLESRNTSTDLVAEFSQEMRLQPAGQAHLGLWPSEWQ